MNQSRGATLQIYVAKHVAAQTLRELLERAETLPWIYLESAADRELTFKETFLEDGVLDTWDHGRAFGPRHEVDWWATPRGFRVRLLTPEAALQGLTWQRPEPRELAPLGAPYTLRLHGTVVEGQGPPPIWSEARIPQDLAYPLPGEAPWPERVGLDVQDYGRARASQVCLTRWLRIVPLAEGGQT